MLICTVSHDFFGQTAILSYYAALRSKNVERRKKRRIEGKPVLRVVSLTSVLLIIIINSTLASLTTVGYVVGWTRKGVSMKEKKKRTLGSSGMEMKSDRIEVAVTSCSRSRCYWNMGFADSLVYTLHRPSLCTVVNRAFYLSDANWMRTSSHSARAVFLSVFISLFWFRSVCLWKPSRFCSLGCGQNTTWDARHRLHAHSRSIAVLLVAGGNQRKKITATSWARKHARHGIVFRVTFRPAGKNKCATLDSY